MDKFFELNIKEGMPVAAEAISNLKNFYKFYKSNKFKGLVVVHGYGSNGVGGAICKKVRQWLKLQKQKRTCKKVIAGEDFNIFNFEALELKNRYKELEKFTKICNHGITIVEF